MLKYFVISIAYKKKHCNNFNNKFIEFDDFVVALKILWTCKKVRGVKSLLQEHLIPLQYEYTEEEPGLLAIFLYNLKHKRRIF